MELGLLHWQQGGHLENVRAHRVWILKVASEQRYTQAQARNLIMGMVLSPGGRRGQLGQALGAMSACSSEDTGELLSREFHDTLSLSVLQVTVCRTSGRPAKREGEVWFPGGKKVREVDRVWKTK